MDFGEALTCLREGSPLSRAGWNAAGQYVVLQPGYPQGVPLNRNTAEATGLPEGTIRKFRPYLLLCAADGSFVPWAPSVSDVLADDWHVLHTAAKAASAPADAEPSDDLLYEAWQLIANAGWDAHTGEVSGDKSPGWHEAALRWRDRFHAAIGVSGPADVEHHEPYRDQPAATAAAVVNACAPAPDPAQLLAQQRKQLAAQLLDDAVSLRPKLLRADGREAEHFARAIEYLTNTHALLCSKSL